MICIICNKLLTGRQKKYCSCACKAKEKSNTINSYESQKNRAKNRKITLIKMKGGKCNNCGYNKNYAGLCFHHKDPTKKEIKLDSRRLANTNWNFLIKELDKCELLCHNCHMEEHYPDLTFNQNEGYDDSYTGKIDKANRVPDPDIESLISLLKQKSIRKVAVDYDVTDMVIHRWIKEFNIEI